MTATITFDTLKLVKRLKVDGFDEQKAEAISDALVESQNAAIADLATKFDFKELDLKIERDFTEVKTEQRLMKWMLGFVLAGIAALVLKTFFV